MQGLKRLWHRFVALLGGKAEARVIVLLALLLALDSADGGAIGGMAKILQDEFQIDKAELGLLVTLSSAVHALSALFFGWLVDRTNRTRLLAITILTWGVAMIVSGTATSYLYLLLARIALGAVIGVSVPATASLVGDWFEPRHRGRVYSFVFSGEMIGTAAGYFVSGELASWWWRLGFWVLALPTPFLAWAFHKLPEPSRDGSSQLRMGQEKLDERHAPKEGEEESPRVGRMAREAGIEPRERLVRAVDPGKQSFFWAMKYVLSIPTNLILIVASGLGYFYLGGLRIFGAEFVRERFHVGHSAAIGSILGIGVGALVGVYVGGFVSDAFLKRGRLRARVWTAAISYLSCAILFFLGLWTSSVWLAVVLFFLAAAALGAINPPLDAARLDLTHPHVWGRSESVRMFFRKIGAALAPILFGVVAESAFSGPTELRDTLMLMLVPFALGGGLAFFTLRTYLKDAAAADAYAEATRK